jgi:pilus assembly protein CpaF
MVDGAADALESRLREAVADELETCARRAVAQGGRAPDETDQRLLARSVIRKALDSCMRDALRSGKAPLSDRAEAATVDRVLTSVFSPAPALDRLLARPDVTDVHVNGCDDVRVTSIDGSVQRCDPVAASDAELIAMIQALARRRGHLEREFTPASPRVDLQLSDGSRLAAAAWVTARPYLTIRRHLLVDADHDDLVRRGMYDPGVRSLLRALVRSRRNVLVCGGQGVGKTTLLRAMLHECDRSERIVVLEQEPELHLDRIPQRHDQVLVFMERAPNSEGVGAVSLADLSRTVKRFTPDRLVVGEVRGPEVIDMLEAMSQGIAGSMCTIHADSSWSVFPRMAVYARSGGQRWSTGDVLELAALAIDVVVFVSRAPGGRRVVAEIRHVDRFDHATGQVVTDLWFRPGPEGVAVPNPMSPIPVALLDDLIGAGYDPALHARDGGR